MGEPIPTATTTTTTTRGSGNKLFFSRVKRARNTSEKMDLQNKVKFNRVLIELLLKFSDFRQKFRDFPASRTRFNTAFEIVRFCWVFYFVIRIGLITFYRSCDYAQLRYYLLDWTVLYPVERRHSVTRCLFALCFILVLSKRSLFTNSKFDCSLLNHLYRNPDEIMNDANQDDVNCKMKEEASNKQKTINTINSNNLSDEENDEEFYFRALFEMEPNIVNKHGGRSHIDNIQLANFNADKQFGSQLFNALLMRSSRSGLFDVNAYWSKFNSYDNNRRLYSDLLATNRIRMNPVEIEVETSESSHFYDLRASANRNVNRDLFHWLYVSNLMNHSIKLTLFFVLLPHAAVILMSSYKIGWQLDCLRACDKFASLLRPIGVVEITWAILEGATTIIGYTMSVIVVAADLRHQLKTCQSRLIGLNSEMDGNQRSNSVEFWESKQVTKMANNQDDSFAYNSNDFDFYTEQIFDMDPKSREILRRVVDVLSSFDQHKPTMSYLGSIAAIWLITCLSFVPLLLGLRVVSSETQTALVIYIVLIASAAITTMIYAVICANLSRQAMLLSKQIYSMCARHQDSLLSKRWLRVIDIWFSGKGRCAFRVGAMDINYANIVKCISYLVTGITFIISLYSRNGSSKDT